MLLHMAARFREGFEISNFEKVIPAALPAGIV